MNDKAIINTISAIYFTIVSLFTIIFFTLLITFIILQNGVHINDISIPNIKIKQLYIKWNEKLNIYALEIAITEKKNQDKQEINEKKINKLFKQLRLFDDWFEEIVIDKIIFNDINTSFKYTQGERGFILASSPTMELNSSIYYESNLLHLEIETLKDLQRDINVKGHLIYNTEIPELSSSLSINIHDDIKLKAYLLANTHKIFYKFNAVEKIKNIQHTIDIAQLPKGILYWVEDAINMSHATLENAYGWLEYNNIQDAYKNINIKATVHKLHYKYNPKLDAIHTSHTILRFIDGIFYIYPKNASTYGFNLAKSWVKIDFTKKEEMLNIILLFKGMLNKDVLGILEAYRIKLPFLQREGLVDVDLNIGVNLHNIKVKAKGDFFVKKANFDYLGLNIDIFDSHISLRNYDVKIDKMLAKYKDIATARVKVNFNAKFSKGNIRFNVLKTDFKDIGIRLKNPLFVVYNISPNNDTISTNKSLWEYAKKEIQVAKIKIPFDLKKLTFNIPTTQVSIPELLSGDVSGKAYLKTSIVDMDINLKKFKTQSTLLTQAEAKLSFKYDKELKLSSKERINFNFNGLDGYIDKMNFKIKDNIFNIDNIAVTLDNIGKTNINGVYNFLKNRGKLVLENMVFKNSTFGNLFTQKEKLTLDIQKEKNRVEVSSEKFSTNFVLNEDEWKLTMDDITNIAQKSKLLKKYHLTQGKLIVYKNFNDKHITFSADLNYPFAILVENNKPTKEYKVQGTLTDKSNILSLVINKVITIKVDKKMQIDMENSGINIDALLNFLNSLESSDKVSSPLNIIFSAKNSYLYISKDRHIISQTINMQYLNRVTTAQLKHKLGKATFMLDKKKFYIHGKDFNDKFMDEMFALSKFRNGKLSFAMSGTTREYDGIFEVKKTTILDYKILNNILAFVNTIPALMTFTLPGYSKHGLKVKEAYMNFHSKDDNLTISNIFMDSKELDILGGGTANFKTNSVDLKLNLKTALGNSVSKIPIVGYILLGKDSVSTSLSIKGALDNPKIKTLIAKDIIVAPLNILLRTLLLPVHLITGVDITKKNLKGVNATQETE